MAKPLTYDAATWLRLTSEMKKEIRRVAKERKMPIQWLIRQAIEAELKRKAKG